MIGTAFRTTDPQSSAKICVAGPEIMEKNETDKFQRLAAELIQDEIGGRRWHAPVLSVFEMSVAHGDPTISDDGLGDGLFS